MYAYYLTEPFAILGGATVVGVLVGRWVTQSAAHAWLGADVTVTTSDVAAGSVALAAALCLVAVAAGSYQTLQRPLIEQLDQARRPQGSTTLLLLGQTVVLVAAAIAIYQAARGSGVQDDWRGLASPALLAPVLTGLAAGQLAAWLLAFSSARAVGPTGRSRRRGLGRFLAVRRLARRRDSAGGGRLVVAAAVVAVVTVTAAGAVTAWQEETVRLRLGGPQRMDVDGGALAAYTLSKQADPDGRWLMAVVAAPDRSEAYRRTFADMDRWERVIGDFFTGTGAAGVSQDATALRAAHAVQPLTGDEASVVFDRSSSTTNTTCRWRSAMSTTTVPSTRRPCLPSARPGPGTDRVSHAGRRLRPRVRRQPDHGRRGNDMRAGPTRSCWATCGSAAATCSSDRGWRMAPGEVHPGCGDVCRGPASASRCSRYSEPIVLTDLGRRQPLAAVSTPGVTLLEVSTETGSPSGRMGLITRSTSSRRSQRCRSSVGKECCSTCRVRSQAPARMVSTATAAILARADTPASVLADLQDSGQVSCAPALRIEPAAGASPARCTGHQAVCADEPVRRPHRWLSVSSARCWRSAPTAETKPPVCGSAACGCRASAPRTPSRPRCLR
ncbi:MAG: hypothetical protein WKF76_07165 [Nocardioidaceae bacterium]